MGPPSPSPSTSFRISCLRLEMVTPGAMVPGSGNASRTIAGG